MTPVCNYIYTLIELGRRSKVRYTWWWNEEVKEAVYRKKEAHKAMCQNSTEENKRRYKGMKNKVV